MNKYFGKRTSETCDMGWDLKFNLENRTPPLSGDTTLNDIMLLISKKLNIENGRLTLENIGFSYIKDSTEVF